MKVRMLTEPAELDELRPDAAIVGAPWDDSTTYRPGARFGPRAVRVANYQPRTVAEPIALGRGRTDPRSGGGQGGGSGDRHAGEVIKDQLRPGLHVQVVAAHRVQRQEGAGQLVDLPDRDLGPITLHQKDEANMDPPHRGGLIVDRAQQPGGEVAVIDDFLLPFPPQPRLDRVGRPGDVLGIDVAAHAQPVEMPKPALAGTSQPVGQEVAIIMTKDDVGNDLRLGSLGLHPPTWPEPVAVADARQQLSQTRVTKACPLVAGKQSIARNDQDLFTRAHRMSLMGLSQSMAREP